MVADLQSVRQAANAVHLSQPAVTQAITKLESQIGASLFDRRSSGTYLNPAGEIFAARTNMMFKQIEDALAAFGVSPGKGRTLGSIIERITRPQIRSLTAVANGRSFADAARRINISQASFHRAARELERNLGKPLFHNSVYGIVTTRGGTELARRLALAVREIEWGMEEIEASSGRRGGQLRVGAMPLAGSFLLAPAINELTVQFPHAQVRVRTGDGQSLTKALRFGEIDFVVGLTRPDADPAEIEQEPLAASPYVVVARRNHPLSRKAKITKADLEACDWIVPMPEATRRVTFDNLFASMRKPPKANIETYALSTIRLLLCGSDRLTLLTRFEFESERATGALTVLPFGPLEPAHFIGVTRRARWSPTALHLKFLELMRAQAAALVRGADLVRAA
jgi:DNA-binding transcriptional LysR family regulator